MDDSAQIRGVNIYDISLAYRPTLVSFIPSTDNGISSSVAQVGNSLYVPTRPELDVYNVAAAAHPQLVTYRPISAILSKVAMLKDYLYVLGFDDDRPRIYDQNGLYTFSLANPASPQKVGYWSDTHGDNDLYVQDDDYGVIAS